MNYSLDFSLFSPNPLLHTAFPFLTLTVENKHCSPPRFGFQAMHWHDDLQFILVLDGLIHIQTLHTTYDVSKGHGVFINKRILHCITEKQPSHYKSFIFPDTLLVTSNDLLRQKFLYTYLNAKDLEVTLLAPLSSSFECLTQLNILIFSSAHNDFYELEVITLLHKLWCTFISNLSLESKGTSTTDKLKEERLHLALSFIHTHFSQYITLETIADSCNISQSTLLKLFKSTLEISPYDYLINFRIKKSIELLRTTSFSISEIATRVGYNSQSQFGKHFKARMHLSPAQYRNSDFS